MKRSELKKLIKPIVKECIAESLIEEGMLYTVVSEVAKGMSPVIMESAPHRAPSTPEPRRQEQDAQAVNELNEQRVQKQKEQRKKLLDMIGNSSYNGVDLFEGTAPAAPERSAASQAHNPLSNVDPGDPGVNIDSFFAGNSKRWNALK
jgi:hypothetical protein